MKKIIISLAMACVHLNANAQQKLTPEKAKLIMATSMAAITEATSFAYTKGMTYQAFVKQLCGSATPTKQGAIILETSFYYLSKGLAKTEIIKENNGKCVADGLQLLQDQKQKGIDPFKSTLFGTETSLIENERQAGKCRWSALVSCSKFNRYYSRRARANT